MNVSDILDELANHGFSDTSDTQKMRVIQDTIWEIESIEPWPWRGKTILLTWDGINPTPTNMPSDFGAVKWMYDTANGVSLWPERWDTIRGKFGNQLTVVSDPMYYYFQGTQLRLYPIPKTTAAIQMDYFANQAILTTSSLEATINLPPRFHRIITLGALVKLYEMEDDPENGQVFEGRYNEKLQRMKSEMDKQQYQRADRIFVVDQDDDWFEPWLP
jgi:hypothetical protein